MSGTQFVQIYHPDIPATIVDPALVAVQSLDEWYAKGWLLVDPAAPPPTPDTPYYTTEAADSRFGQLAGDNTWTGANDFAEAPTVGGLPIGSGFVPDASITVKGVVELATTAEATTGTDTSRAVTPAGVKAVVDGLTNPAAYTDEQVMDLIGSTIVAGTGIAKTVDDAGNTVTISATGGGGGGGGGSTLNKVFYVSKAGSDANDGLGWGSAKLTIAGALALLPTNTVGTIEVGAGVFQETLTLAGGKVIRGQGRYATIIELTSSGNLITVNNENNSRLEHLGLRFASSSVTGNLLYHTNAFTCDYEDVRFSGTNTAGQIGYRYDANAGDSHFLQCYFDALDVGVLSESTLVHFAHCIFSSNTTASVKGGDPTGAVAAAGASFESCTFRGAGARYVHIDGKAQAWSFNNCWFDGAATTAIEVGTGTQGPWLFSLTNCPALVGVTNSLIINAAGRVNLAGVAFTNTGTYPTELTVNATNAPRGSIQGCWSVQDTKLETKVGPKWQGWVGYVSSPDDTVALVETAEEMRVPNFPQTKRRVVVRIANRSTGNAAATLTFPSAFETTFGGGTFFKTFDNSGLGAGLVITNTTVTIPTGVAVTNAMIVIEGY